MIVPDILMALRVLEQRTEIRKTSPNLKASMRSAVWVSHLETRLNVESPCTRLFKQN